MDGFDTPSLSILASLDLSPSNPGDRNEYFRRSIQELGIDILDSEDNILVRFSGLLCKGLLWGEIDPKDALSMLVSYNNRTFYFEPLFNVWYSVDDEIDLINDGYLSIYKNDVNETNQNEYIKKIAEQYIALLETPLPEWFFSASICGNCNFFGVFPPGNGGYVCPKCNSKDALQMRNSYAGREKFLRGLGKEQA